MDTEPANAHSGHVGHSGNKVALDAVLDAVQQAGGVDQLKTVWSVLTTGWVLEEGDERLSGFDLHLPKPILGPNLEETVAATRA